MIPEIEGYKNWVGDKPSVAVVGFGKMGLLHSTIINLLGAGSVDAVVDSNRLLRFATTKIMKTVAFYKELDELLARQSPDAVYVTTPAASHAPVVKRLIKAGIRSIFLEKPPTLNSKELSEILTMLNRDHIVMVGFQKRYALTFRHAKSLLDQGVIGTANRVSSSIGSNDISRRTNRFDSVGRGALLDLGIHLVDLLAWMFEVEDVVSSRKRSLYTEVDDDFEATLRTKDGAIIGLQACWSQPHYRLPETEIEIHGSHGVITVTEDFLKAKVQKDESVSETMEICLYKPHYYRGTPPVNIADPEYTLENMHFLYCMSRDVEPLTSLRNTQETMSIVDEAYSKASRD
jgi:predicted dehydrogenase